jgi:MFS family permease
MAGLMVPQILAIIQVTFPRHERGKVLGLWGGVAGSASAAGLVVGGLLVQWDLFGLQWRPIFLVNIPIGIAAMVAAVRVVPESRSPTAPRLDLIGMAIAVTGVLMLVYPLTEGRRLGWPAWTFLLMAGSVLLLAAFVAYERRRTRTKGSPLVVLDLFRARAFASGMVAWLVFWIALGGFFLMWTLYLQVGLGWTPLHAGLTAVTFAVGASAGAGLAVTVLTPRFGRWVLMAGALLNAGGFISYLWAATRYGPEISSWQMVPPLVLTGFGFGLVVAPMIDAILTAVPVRDAGSASGLLNTTQQVGMALGIALVGVLFFAQLDRDSGRGVDEVTPQLQEQLTAAGVPDSDQDGIVAGFRACVRDRSAATDPTEIPASCQAGSPPPGAPADQLPELLTRAGEQANAYNFSRTFGITLWYAAGVLVVVFLGLFALPRRVRERDLDAELATPRDEPALRS